MTAEVVERYVQRWLIDGDWRKSSRLRKDDVLGHGALIRPDRSSYQVGPLIRKEGKLGVVGTGRSAFAWKSSSGSPDRVHPIKASAGSQSCLPSGSGSVPAAVRPIYPTLISLDALLEKWSCTVGGWRHHHATLFERAKQTKHDGQPRHGSLGKGEGCNMAGMQREEIETR